MQLPSTHQSQQVLRTLLLPWGSLVSAEDKLTPVKLGWRYWTGVLLATCILAARDWEKLAQPRFIAEDGTIFFAQAYNLSTWAALTTPYAGYYHLVPRLVAEVGQWLPFAAIPFFYACSALLITSFALTWFLLPHFRYLVPSDQLRFAFVCLLILMPNVGALLQLAYIQWYLAVWALSVALMPPLQHKWQQWLLALCYGLVIFTAPVLVIWLPLWIVRFVLTKDFSQRLWLGSIIGAQLFFMLGLWFVPQPPSGLTADLRLLSTDVLLGFLYQVFVLNLLGHTLSIQLFATGGWTALCTIALLMLGLSLWALRKQQNPAKRWLSLGLLYIVVGAAALYAQRAPLFKFMFVRSQEGMHFAAARYFWISSVAFCLFSFIQISAWFEQKRTAWRYGLLLAGWLGLVMVYSLSFRMSPWGYVPWAPTAQLLTTLQANQAQPAQAALSLVRDNGSLQPVPPAAVVLNIPVAPAGWTMSLNIPRSTAIYSFPEGPWLLGVHSQVKQQILAVNLDWQGETQVQPGENLFYTAYVHLLDEQRTRLAGADVLLEAPPHDELGQPLVFQSHHLLELPANLLPGNYDLAIGLYHFKADQLVDGHRVLATQRVVIAAGNQAP